MPCPIVVEPIVNGEESADNPIVAGGSGGCQLSSGSNKSLGNQAIVFLLMIFGLSLFRLKVRAN